MSAVRQLLHVGCGSTPNDRLPSIFRSTDWREIRFDIDPTVEPEIIGSITEMSAIDTASIDAIYSSHNLEHIDSFQVPRALSEFRRVLRPNGFVVVTVPDLKAVSMQVVTDRLDDVLYVSNAGPITALDIIFGHQSSVQRGNRFMAHRTGFTANTLGTALIAAGFDEVRVREGTNYDLWALATLAETPPTVFAEFGQVTN